MKDGKIHDGGLTKVLVNLGLGISVFAVYLCLLVYLYSVETVPIDNGWKAALVTWSLPRWSTMCVVGNCSKAAPTSEAVKHYIMNKKTKTNSWSSRQLVSRQWVVGFIFSQVMAISDFILFIMSVMSGEV